MNEYALVTLELEILSPEASPFGNSTHCFVISFFRNLFVQKIDIAAAQRDHQIAGCQ